MATASEVAVTIDAVRVGLLEAAKALDDLELEIEDNGLTKAEINGLKFRLKEARKVAAKIAES